MRSTPDREPTMPTTSSGIDPREAALREACRPLLRETQVASGRVLTLLGWERDVATMPEAVVDALHAAYPLPGRLRDALDEVAHWREQAPELRDRYGEVPIWVRARTGLLAEILDTRPEPTLDGLQARARWLSDCLSGKVIRARDWHARCLAAIHADIDAWRAAAEGLEQKPVATPALASAEPEPQPAGHSPQEAATTAPAADDGSKRDAVLALIGTPEGQGMSSRAIARRLGVSPTTVRKARAAAA